MDNCEQVQSIRDIVALQIPRPFLRDFCLIQPRLYDIAWEAAVQHLNDKAERKYLYPHLRRALTEQAMAELAAHHKGTLINDHRPGCSFREVQFGDVSLTASYVRRPSFLVRKAVFRETRAQGNQILMFPKEEGAHARSTFFGILLHGSNYCGSRATFTFLGFPAPDLSSYVERIDLISYCGLAADNIRPSDIEEIEDRVKPQLILERLKARV